VLGNQNEIAQAKLAQQRSKNQEVIAFAQTMEKEHQQFLSQLQKFAGMQFEDRRLEGGAGARSGTRTNSSNEDSSNTTNSATSKSGNANQNNANQNRNESARTQAGATRTENGAPGAGNSGSMVTADSMLQIKRELADECLNSSRRELEAKQGKEFDECYMGMQLAEHMKMIDELKVFERHASSDFRTVLQQGRETAEKHLTHAKQIKKNVEEGRGGQGAERSSSKTSSSDSK